MRIVIRDKSFECKPAMNPLQIANQCLSVVMATMKQDIAECPEEHRQTLTDHYYNNFNTMASEFLQELCPDRDLRPDLTFDAINKAEAELLAEKENKCGVQDATQN